MKPSSSVRRPSLVNANKGGNNSVVPVGEVLRKAKNDLFFSRCLIVILVIISIVVLVGAFSYGYISQFIDYLLSFVE